MSYPALTVPDMTGPLWKYDITVTVDSPLPRPEVFAHAAQRAASSRAASIMSAHTAEQTISIVTVAAPDEPAAVAIALAVLAEALKRPVASASR
jgi:hypothetical protein